MENLYDETLNFIRHKFEVGESDLIKYEKPLSVEHIKYLEQNILCRNDKFDIENNYSKFIFARFIFSWQNGTGKGFIKLPDIKDELCELTLNYDLVRFCSMYKIPGKLNKNPEKTIFDLKKSVLSVYLYIKNNAKFKHINTIRRETDLMYLVEGIVSIANILLPHVNEWQGLKSDKILNKKNEQSLVGMSWALFSDAVKESGIIDISKPDIHIIEILKIINTEVPIQIDNENKFKKYTNIFENLVKISSNKNISNYMLDKVIWLACTGDLYLDNKKNESKTNRQEYIEYLQEKKIL